jgi:putative SOS response-associated peptidase YedK
MCYSAKVWQQVKEYMRYHGVVPAFDQYELLLQRRLSDPSIRIARAFEDNFAEPGTPQERRIKALIDEYRSSVATQWEQELFKQKKRLADAQRVLKTKETKAARESERIATNKVQSLTERLTDLKRTEPKSRDSRIYPMHFAPIVIRQGKDRQLVLARYHCRPKGKPPSIDRQFPGLYNARRDNLEKFWRNDSGHSHALAVMDAFYENVERDGKNVVLRFEPKPSSPMLVACLYSRWSEPGAGELFSFAAITDEPPVEVSAAGHDRCVVSIKQKNVETWLTPEERSAKELQAILDDVERPYYEHEVLAA